MEYKHIPRAFWPKPISVKQTHGAGGGLVSGVDCSKKLSDDVVLELRQAWLKYGVLFFKDQKLSDEQFMQFGEQFGELFVNENFTDEEKDGETGPKFRQVKKVLKEVDNFRVVGEDFHADTCHVANPPMASILYGIEVPPFGAETWFSNLNLAYESLSPGMKDMIKDVKCVMTDDKVAGPDSNRHYGRGSKIIGNPVAEPDSAGNKPPENRDIDMGGSYQAPIWELTGYEHPLVKIHPETGNKSLFVNFSYTRSFANMSVEESMPLMNYLYRWCERPEFQFRFRMEVGSIAMWDNRAVNHMAVNDYQGYRRECRRIQLKDVPDSNRQFSKKWSSIRPH